jgi:hypothetical protein
VKLDNCVPGPLLRIRIEREKKVSVAIGFNGPTWLNESICRLKVVHGRRPADIRLQRNWGRRCPSSLDGRPRCLGQPVTDRKPFSFDLTASSHGRYCCGD